MATSFDVKSFYGGHTSLALGSLQRRLQRAARFAGSTTTSLSTHLAKGSLAPKNYCENVSAFSSQKDAIVWREEAEKKNLAVFALELDAEGRRSFLVAHPKQAWKMIRAKKRLARYAKTYHTMTQYCKIKVNVMSRKLLL